MVEEFGDIMGRSLLMGRSLYVGLRTTLSLELRQLNEIEDGGLVRASAI